MDADAGSPPDGSSADANTPPGTSWDVLVRSRTSAAEPDVAVGPDGESYVAWIHDGIEAAVVGADGTILAEPDRVQAPLGLNWLFDPTLCVTPDGVALLAASCVDYDADSERDGHICVARSAGGGPFDAFEIVDPELPPVTGGRFYDRPWIACGPDGTVALVWSRVEHEVKVKWEADGKAWLRRMSELTVSDDGESWRTPVTIANWASLANLAVASRSRIFVTMGRALYLVDASVWPPQWGPALAPVYMDRPSIALSGDVIYAQDWYGDYTVSVDGGLRFSSQAGLGVLGDGPNVALADVASGADGSFRVAWFQGWWTGVRWPSWRVHLATWNVQAGWSPTIAWPEEPMMGTTEDEDVDRGRWLGHYIGVAVGPEGDARVVWPDARDGPVAIRLSRYGTPEREAEAGP